MPPPPTLTSDLSNSQQQILLRLPRQRARHCPRHSPQRAAARRGTHAEPCPRRSYHHHGLVARPHYPHHIHATLDGGQDMRHDAAPQICTRSPPPRRSHRRRPAQYREHYLPRRDATKISPLYPRRPPPTTTGHRAPPPSTIFRAGWVGVSAPADASLVTTLVVAAAAGVGGPTTVGKRLEEKGAAR